MKISYFPGCTLKTKAKELDIYTRKCALALGVELEEIEDWQCCGGVFSMAKDEIASKLSSVRALSYAAKNGGKIVRPTVILVLLLLIAKVVSELLFPEFWH